MSLETRIEEANQLQIMVSTPGWKVVEDEAKTRISKLTKMLVASDDDIQTRDLKANIRGLEFLLAFPFQMMEAAQKASEAQALENPAQLAS